MRPVPIARKNALIEIHHLIEITRHNDETLETLASLRQALAINSASDQDSRQAANNSPGPGHRRPA
jgi:hypothetical protein